MRETFKQLMTEYGPFAVAVYFTIFFAVLLGTWAAIHLGWQPQSATGSVGALGAAYVVTKLTQPVRIAVTLVLTPLVAKVYQRVTRQRVA